MDQIGYIIAYAALPALGNLIGNLLAELVKPPRWVVGTALHGAAGIAIALVSIDLMPRMLDTLSVVVIAPAFLVGAAVSVLLAYGIRLFSQGSGETGQGAWMVFAAIGADLFSDGLMTGAGSAIDSKLGILIASSQLIANIPGGFAVAANLRQRKVSLRSRAIASAALFAGVVASAVSGYVLLRGTTEDVQNTVIAAMVGLILLATVEDLIPEADAPRPSRWLSSLAFTVGFIGFALASGLLFAMA